MTEGNDQDEAKGRLSLRPAGRMELGRTVDAGSVRQSFSHGRSKVVQVEVRKKRPTGPGPNLGAPPPIAPAAPPTSSPSALSGGLHGAPAKPATADRPAVALETKPASPTPPLPTRPSGIPGRGMGAPRALTAAELASRQRALDQMQRDTAKRDAERREQEKISIMSAAEEARRREEDARRAAEEEARQQAEAARAKAAEDAARQAAEAAPAPATSEEPRRPVRPTPAAAPISPTETLRLRARTGEEEDEARRTRRPGSPMLPARKPPIAAPKKGVDDRRGGRRIDVQAAMEGEDERVRSLASVRRQRERERRQQELEILRADGLKVTRDVVLPETITVGELANRMAARGADVIKSLMKMGVMATIAESIDADTAELIVQEFGHRVRRVADSDVELGIEGEADQDEDLLPRPPVVTIMGHVDHGKTSLLDALRSTDVAAGEAGGITQHIGAYQVELASGGRITFIDTPGHEAFTAMRARGAGVTDIVVLVVAADDGVMPQTIEAIRHAKAANVPIIVAINKMDMPGADPARVRTELLSHEIVVESLGGDVQEVLVSAKARTGLDKLQEAILLQAEVLDLRVNPERNAEGTVIEGRLDRGRGPVATLLIQKGTLLHGDIIVAGSESGRVRVIVDDKGNTIKEAGPSTPVEILGLSSVPAAGEPFIVVEDEARAREIAEFRQRRTRDHAVVAAAGGRGSLEEMLSRIQAGVQKEVAVVIKADTQGTAEALAQTVLKQAHEEVRVRVLTASVGQITESDVQLAKASAGVVVAFNVRATAQARALATRDGVSISYYSIIYDVADDIEKLVKGKVAPKARERFLGYAEVRKVFDITKTGKVAGCMITEGLVKRGAGVRLLRDGVVIHTGELSQLKRFKDDVREVARGYECGLSFAGFNDLREGDMVECFEVEMVPG
jgi:translation initiation factor IF-2